MGVDRDHVEAAAGRVEGDAGAGDAEADDQQVGVVGQAGQAGPDPGVGVRVGGAFTGSGPGRGTW